ncbi:apolipoprotein N-acyltransferase [Prosthecodimorpha hirschii]|uniref:apolipoprotein N-acyltransferase n=1 Tax=Prosthecodimorpha hirschii TaxID=665126 RepID=UPI001FEF1F91|nr:apolipoprotein N-acyltransferase [Prosthecomicrobium hirschii]
MSLAPTDSPRPARRAASRGPGRAGPVERIAGSLVLAWGWRRALAAGLAGGLAALSQAPIHAFPVLWIALPVLVFLLDGAVETADGGRSGRWRAAFGIGWCFGAGYFLAGLWWIGSAFLVDPLRFGWLLPIALAALSAGLGLFTGLGTLIARLLWTDGPARILALAVGLWISEYLRGHILTGFPWNALGYGLAANDTLMQAASLVGLDGMTLLAGLIFAAPAAAVGRGRAGLATAAAGLALFAAVAGFGVWRLPAQAVAVHPGIKLRIMQPAIDQSHKWKPEFRDEILARYNALSTATGTDGQGLAGVTHLIWPESAFPFLLTYEPEALRQLADLLPSGTILLTGAIRAEPPAPGESRTRYFNSIYVIGENASILAAYDKAHLVPFGEYLPAQDTLEAIGLRQLTHLRGGFTPGPGLQTLAVPGAPAMGPLICYEAIFPDAVVDARNRPEWLLNVTNDAWFGLTPGPYQHFHQVRLRTVEEGLPLVRAANSGISAVIDGYGRVISSLKLGQSALLDAQLPVSLPATFYSEHRSNAFWLAAICMLCLVLIRARRLS